MDINKQAQLIRRIQADLRKEAHKHMGDGNDMSAVDCDGQADALDAVLATLKGADMMTEALSLLSSNEKVEERYEPASRG